MIRFESTTFMLIALTTRNAAYEKEMLTVLRKYVRLCIRVQKLTADYEKDLSKW